MDRPLDLRQLEAFAAVALAGSVTSGAQLLGRSQPSVTRQIQELEAELGFTLLQRGGRRLSLTERGARFHAEVERHLGGLQELRRKAEGILQGGPASLTVASIPAFAAGLLPRALAEVSEITETPTELLAIGGAEVVRSVLSRLADLGFVSLPLREEGLTLHWAVEVPCIAVLRADDPLASEAVLPLHRLATERVITTANQYRPRQHVEDALQEVAREIGRPRTVPLVTSTSFGALGAVRAGLGIALVEPLTPLGAPLQGLVLRPLDRDLPFRYGAVTATDRPLRPLVAQILERLLGLLEAEVPGLRLIETASAELLPLPEESGA